MNNLVPTNIEVPAHLANRVGQPSALSVSLSGGMSREGSSHSRISIKAPCFKTPR